MWSKYIHPDLSCSFLPVRQRTDTRCWGDSRIRVQWWRRRMVTGGCAQRSQTRSVHHGCPYISFHCHLSHRTRWRSRNLHYHITCHLFLPFFFLVKGSSGISLWPGCCRQTAKHVLLWVIVWFCCSWIGTYQKFSSCQSVVFLRFKWTTELNRSSHTDVLTRSTNFKDKGRTLLWERFYNVFWGCGGFFEFSRKISLMMSWGLPGLRLGLA